MEREERVTVATEDVLSEFLVIAGQRNVAVVCLEYLVLQHDLVLARVLFVVRRIGKVRALSDCLVGATADTRAVAEIEGEFGIGIIVQADFSFFLVLLEVWIRALEFAVKQVGDKDQVVAEARRRGDE